MAAQGTHERHAATNQPRRAFAIREHPDLERTPRLTLLGDLDLTTADTFRSRLAELKPSGRPVRLDLSQLAFIDSSGIEALTRGAHRRPVDRMAARCRSADQPHRGAGS